MPSTTFNDGCTRPINRISVAHLCTLLFLLAGLPLVDGLHHMAQKAPWKTNRRKLDITPLLVTNHCPDNIWPGISTQSGTGPGQNGFQLKPGKPRTRPCQKIGKAGCGDEPTVPSTMTERLRLQAKGKPVFPATAMAP
ncbi:hypothetical protein P3342_006439 [Pyrenophora teres f. teres]|nr:hypothetical protein P3342_006439 [Pyrenophora teres f. teres]